MKANIVSKLTAFLLSAAMVFAMAPLTGGTVHAASGGADGGPVVSNSETNAKAAFGEDNVTAEYSGGTLTITLLNDIALDSPVVLKRGNPADHVIIDLNDHSITGAAGSSGSDYAAAQGLSAIEIQPADYNVTIKGSGSIIGGKGAVYENSDHQRIGEPGGSAICFVKNDDGSYWYTTDDSSKLNYGLKITDGAMITGGSGADLTGEDWVNNILNCSFSTSYSPQFNLQAGTGGPGITQTNAGIKGAIETPIFTRIEIVDGTVTGGTGGKLDLSTEQSPVMTHYGLMNSPAIDTYMQSLYAHHNTYDDYVVNAMELYPGKGGDGVVIGLGRKYVNVEADGVISGGPCGETEYGDSHLVNNIENVDNRVSISGNGVNVYGDLGLTTVDPTYSESNWSSKTKNSNDMGLYIAGTVKGGSSPTVDALNENAGDGGSGIVMHGEFDHNIDIDVSYPSAEYFNNWGIVEVDTGGTICGGNGGSAVNGNVGYAGYGVYEAYTKSDSGRAGCYNIGTDSYLINGTVTGGNGGDSMSDNSCLGGHGFLFGNYRKGLRLFGEGTAWGGNGGSYVVHDTGTSDEGTAGIALYGLDNPDYDDVVDITSKPGLPCHAVDVDNSGLSVTTNMSSFKDYPSTSTQLSCTVNKPAGYSGNVYIKWTAELKLQSNESEICDIEPSGTDSSSFNLLSDEQYKYLAYKTYPDDPQSDSMSYNVELATTDRINYTIKHQRSWAEISCTVQLEDGRWAESKPMHFTNEGWNSGGGEDPQGDHTAAYAVMDMIDSLPDNASIITLAHADAVAAAREAYENLSNADKDFLNAYVYLFEKLEAAENKIAELKQPAIEVIGQIENLQNTIDPASIDNTDKDAITAASGSIQSVIDAYNALSIEQKRLIDEGTVDDFNDLIDDMKALIEAYNGQVEDDENLIDDTLSRIEHQGTATVLQEDMVSVAKATYTGKKLEPKVTVVADGRTLTQGTDYTIDAYKNNINAGTDAAVVVTGKGFYGGTVTKNFTINKAGNTLNVVGKTVKIKHKKVKKKKQTLAATRVINFKNKGQGTLSYAKVKGNKKILINSKNGTVTVKKKLKKGKYKVKVKVRAAGNANYNASAWKTTTFVIKVK